MTEVLSAVAFVGLVAVIVTAAGLFFELFLALFRRSWRDTISVLLRNKGPVETAKRLLNNSATTERRHRAA